MQRRTSGSGRRTWRGGSGGATCACRCRQPPNNDPPVYSLGTRSWGRQAILGRFLTLKFDTNNGPPGGTTGGPRIITTSHGPVPGAGGGDGRWAGGLRHYSPEEDLLPGASPPPGFRRSVFCWFLHHLWIAFSPFIHFCPFPLHPLSIFGVGGPNFGPPRPTRKRGIQCHGYDKQSQMILLTDTDSKLFVSCPPKQSSKLNWAVRAGLVGGLAQLVTPDRGGGQREAPLFCLGLCYTHGGVNDPIGR